MANGFCAPQQNCFYRRINLCNELHVGARSGHADSITPYPKNGARCHHLKTAKLCCSNRGNLTDPLQIATRAPSGFGNVTENQMDCTVKWLDGMAFIAETGTGHLVTMDGAPEAGGRNLAPRPMELLLAGAGGCSAFDVVLILKRARQAVTGCEVRLDAERADADPKVFTRITFHYTVSGHNLKPEVVKRAIDLSAEKYCSASIMLSKTAEMLHEWTIVETGPQAAIESTN